ncbi:MAG: chaperone NapD [Pseudomonadota bacterium]|nr:chaperone NapD [Pseudomonadota bacterium]
MNREFHISSFIVQARPEHCTNLRTQLTALPGVEVHHTTAEGKIIVTLECRNTGEISDTTTTINQLPGVLSCNMVFHQIEQESTTGHMTIAH